MLGSTDITARTAELCVCQDGNIAYMWLPGQIRYLAPHGHNSWCCVTADGSTWLQLLRRHSGRTNARFRSRRRRSYFQGYAGIATLPCVKNTLEFWIGRTTGVYRTNDGQVSGCGNVPHTRRAQLEHMVAAASAHDEIRVWNTVGTALAVPSHHPVALQAEPGARYQCIHIWPSDARRRAAQNLQGSQQRLHDH